MRFLYFLFFFCISFVGLSQNSFSKEFSLLSDNDLYTSVSRDRYYTNGLFLNYRSISTTKNEQLLKKIHHFQIGHMMFTPFKATLSFASTHDRPFAAYLYASYGQQRHFSSQNILITKLQLGIIGPGAKGAGLQNFIHQIYNYPKATGWEHQIKNAFAANLNATFIKHFSKENSSHLDFSNYNELNAGSVFTNFSTGIYTRIGIKKLQALSNSVAFHSNLNNSSSTSAPESFFFIKPMLNFVLYDATIQGSFLNTSSPVTFKVKPIVFSLELGYKYYHKRFLYGYTFHFHTKKLRSHRATKSNSYGGIYIGYYFN